jgi:hypothetical protein
MRHAHSPAVPTPVLMPAQVPAEAIVCFMHTFRRTESPERVRNTQARLAE